jgi:hypothetical protein
MMAASADCVPIVVDCRSEDVHTGYLRSDIDHKEILCHNGLYAERMLRSFVVSEHLMMRLTGSESNLWIRSRNQVECP